MLIIADCCQAMIGSCDRSDIAMSVATRVIGQYPERGEVLVDCGWTALSQDGHGALPGGSYSFIEGFPNLRYDTCVSVFDISTINNNNDEDDDEDEKCSLFVLLKKNNAINNVTPTDAMLKCYQIIHITCCQYYSLRVISPLLASI